MLAFGNFGLVGLILLSAQLSLFGVRNQADAEPAATLVGAARSVASPSTNVIERIKAQVTGLGKVDLNWCLAVNRGCAHADAGRFEQALDEYATAITLDPTAAIAYFDRSSVYFAQGKTERAITDLTKVIELAPTYSNAYSCRARVYRSVQRYAQAIGDLTRCIALDPTSAKAYTDRGDIYRELNRTPEAFADYKVALARDPDYVPALLSRAELSLSTGWPLQAVDDYTTALEIAPKPEIYFKRGRAYAMKDLFVEACEDYNKAITLDPNFIDAYIEWGVIFTCQGRLLEAITEHTKAIKMINGLAAGGTLHPNAYRAYQYRGVNSGNLQHWAEAYADLQMALALCPDESKKPDIRKSLEQTKAALRTLGIEITDPVLPSPQASQGQIRSR